VTSDKKIEANRRNAKHATGPRTERGKAHSSQNARKHGLATTQSWSPAMLGRIEKLALMLVGPNASNEQNELARNVAHAHWMLDLVQETKRICIEQHVFGKTQSNRGRKKKIAPLPATAWVQGQFSAMSELVKLDRYECRALSRRNRGLQLLRADSP
jgi:hypothetical protein